MVRLFVVAKILFFNKIPLNYFILIGTFFRNSPGATENGVEAAKKKTFVPHNREDLLNKIESLKLAEDDDDDDFSFGESDDCSDFEGSEFDDDEDDE